MILKEIAHCRRVSFEKDELFIVNILRIEVRLDYKMIYGTRASRFIDLQGS